MDCEDVTRMPIEHHYPSCVIGDRLSNVRSERFTVELEDRVSDLLAREARALMALWTLARGTNPGLYDHIRDRASAPTGVDPDGWDHDTCLADPLGYQRYVERLEDGLGEAITVDCQRRDTAWARLTGAGS